VRWDARLLASPDMLLLDEPLARSTPRGGTTLLPYLEKLARETRLPMPLCQPFGGRKWRGWPTPIVVLQDGRVKAQGSCSIY